MAYQVSPTWTDTTTGVTQGTWTVPKTNAQADFRAVTDKPGTFLMTNLTCPIGYPETVKISCQPVNDIYAEYNIDKALYAPSRKGISFLVSQHHVYREVNTDDPTYEVAVPSGCSIVWKGLQGPRFTEAMIIEDLERLTSWLKDTDQATGETRIAAIIRGALAPKDL